MYPGLRALERLLVMPVGGAPDPAGLTIGMDVFDDRPGGSSADGGLAAPSDFDGSTLDRLTSSSFAALDFAFASFDLAVPGGGDGGGGGGGDGGGGG